MNYVFKWKVLSNNNWNLYKTEQKSSHCLPNVRRTLADICQTFAGVRWTMWGTVKYWPQHSTEQCSSHKKTPLTYQYQAHTWFRGRGRWYVCWRISVSFKASNGVMSWMTPLFSFPSFLSFVTLPLTLVGLLPVPVCFPLRLLHLWTFSMTPSVRATESWT